MCRQGAYEDTTANDDDIFFCLVFSNTSCTFWKLQDALGFATPARHAKKGAKCISTQA